MLVMMTCRLHAVVGKMRNDMQLRMKFGKPSVVQGVNPSFLISSCPFARSSFARIELNYPTNSGIAERRKVQSQVLTALKQQLPTTNIEGQGSRALWFTRNRSPEERAKLRAILSTKDAISKLRPAADLDLDWRGKLFVEGHNIIGFSGPQPPPEDAFLHTTTRGDHSGLVRLC